MIYLIIIILIASAIYGAASILKRKKDMFSKYTQGLKIRYFCLEADLKSGDAILIQTPSGKNILIDAGFEKTGDQLDRYLNKLNIHKLDYAVATHPHHDHIGGYCTILKTKIISKLLTINVPHITPLYKRFIEMIEEQKVPVQYLQDGDSIQIEEDLNIEILNPPKGVSPETLPETMDTPYINNLSMVMKLTYKNRTFLFTADLYEERELEIVKRHGDKLKADFLDVPHHGDNTSSTNQLIEAVGAEYYVISANIMQSEEIYQKYVNTGGEVYITSHHGHISVCSDGEMIEVIVQKG